jgi:hypothetical protein
MRSSDPRILFSSFLSSILAQKLETKYLIGQKNAFGQKRNCFFTCSKLKNIGEKNWWKQVF